MLCQAAFQRANVLGYELIHSCLPTVILALLHLRTSNPIESIFSGVKLRTDPHLFPVVSRAFQSLGLKGGCMPHCLAVLASRSRNLARSETPCEGVVGFADRVSL